MTKNKVSILKLTAKDKWLQEAFAIRRKVFVVEQKVAEEEEYDEHEESATHFIALIDQHAVGTARWRFTNDGIKLERFAVLKEYRGRGVGSALLQSVLDDVRSVNKDGKKIYLHAQLDAIPFYSGFNFQMVGERFSECNILHYKMQWLA
jgi:predicted GNAT family N-acyltransferase